MGTVHLARSHHRLYIHERPEVDLDRRILLTPGLLARPISHHESFDESPFRATNRAALQALMDLPGFNAAVSYGVTDKGGVQHLATSRRIWGEITLGTPDNVVARFSHDSRHSNYPFVNMLQWLEEEYTIDKDSTWPEMEAFYEKWSSAELWRAFFEDRIRRQIETVRTKAELLQQEAQAMLDRASAIERALKNQAH